MTERALYGALALLLVGLCLLAMANLHREHYKNRKWQILVARVNALEQIIGGEHD